MQDVSSGSPGGVAGGKGGGLMSHERREQRQLHLTSAAMIKPLPVSWLWDRYLPVGEVTLLGGREGTGKSTLSLHIAAALTTGALVGQYQGQPKSVLVAASEDNWAHTIVPRLIVAGADLSRIYRVDVAGSEDGVSLRTDLGDLRLLAKEVDAALLLVDPLVSSFGAALDANKETEVRQVLEPLARFSHETGVTVLGLLHVNKGTSSDPLTRLMGSRAFTGVARSVLVTAQDPDDPDLFLLGHPKSNLGPRQSTFAYRIEEVRLSDGIVTSKIKWEGRSERSLSEALRAVDNPQASATSEAATTWLRNYLTSHDGCVDSSMAKDAAKAAGHSDFAIRNARRRLEIAVSNTNTTPRRTIWGLPGSKCSAHAA